MLEKKTLVNKCTGLLLWTEHCFYHDVLCYKDYVMNIWLLTLIFYLFPKQQILDSSKLKEFADNNFKFDENVRKFSKKDRKQEEKGEIARY